MCKYICTLHHDSAVSAFGDFVSIFCFSAYSRTDCECDIPAHDVLAMLTKRAHVRKRSVAPARRRSAPVRKRSAPVRKRDSLANRGSDADNSDTETELDQSHGESVAAEMDTTADRSEQKGAQEASPEMCQSASQAGHEDKELKEIVSRGTVFIAPANDCARAAGARWAAIEMQLPAGMCVRETRAGGACAAAVVSFELFGSYGSTGVIRELLTSVYSNESAFRLFFHSSPFDEPFARNVNSFKTQLVNQFNEGNALMPQMLISTLEPLELQFQRYASAIHQKTTFLSEYDMQICSALFGLVINVFTPHNKTVLHPPDRATCRQLLELACSSSHVRLLAPATALEEISLANDNPNHYRAVGCGERGHFNYSDKAQLGTFSNHPRWTIVSAPVQLTNADPPCDRESLLLIAFHSFFGRTLHDLLDISGLDRSASFADVEAAIMCPESQLYFEYEVSFQYCYGS